MKRARKIVVHSGKDCGQASVEAAFLIPVLLMGVLLLVQPAILLYDRMIMSATASEACRLLVTKTDVLGSMDESCEAFVRHRLAAIPQVSCFHVHEGECSWEILLEGDETSDTVSVSIKNQVEPLPLLGSMATLLGITNASGYFELEVTCFQSTQPSWVSSCEVGQSPSSWVGAWLS